MSSSGMPYSRLPGQPRNPARGGRPLLCELYKYYKLYKPIYLYYQTFFNRFAYSNFGV